MLAGGLDPSCGLTRSGPMPFLPRLVGPTVDPAGDLWLAVGEVGDGPNRLVRLSGDGELQVVAQPVPGQVDDLVATADGGVDLLVAGPDSRALWRLPAARPRCPSCRHRRPAVWPIRPRSPRRRSWSR